MTSKELDWRAAHLVQFIEKRPCSWFLSEAFSSASNKTGEKAATFLFRSKFNAIFSWFSLQSLDGREARSECFPKFSKVLVVRNYETGISRVLHSATHSATRIQLKLPNANLGRSSRSPAVWANTLIPKKFNYQLTSFTWLTGWRPITRLNSADPNTHANTK